MPPDAAALKKQCEDKLYDLESETEEWAQRLEMIEDGNLDELEMPDA